MSEGVYTSKFLHGYEMKGLILRHVFSPQALEPIGTAEHSDGPLSILARWLGGPAHHLYICYINYNSDDLKH